ncbi:hypothetical protein [Roseobacter weihaiensis]|uniref:hypothetical protein n=1 Tax=Roseobacter weihaiensis TaxID=2763262 RepID=UPI001D0A0C22|nr:hypothetical protein [Roseobacter sp. H9]
MRQQEDSMASGNGWLWTFVLIAIAVICGKVAVSGDDALAELASADSDDIMRFLSVRDWLAGQGWFDMRQTGVVAEGGLTLHWSRLIDLGIAAIIWPSSVFLTMEDAEAVGIILWPVLLHSLLILLTAREALRNFGPRIAAGAVLCLLMWPLLLHNYFQAGRLDHHNVQIVLLTVVVFSLLRDRPTWRSGAIAGFTTAFSLAVGLETLLAHALVGLLLSWRAVRSPDVFALPLLGYAVTLGSGSALFFAVQTTPSSWFYPQCDQLGLPLLHILAVTSGAAAVLAFALRRRPSYLQRLACAGVLYCGALALAAPAVLVCASGPYGNLPPALEAAIYANIREARPALLLALEAPETFHVSVAPLLTALLFATALWRCDSDQARKTKIGTLLIFGWLAAIATLFQLRMIVIGAAVVPILTGYALGRAWDWRQRQMQGQSATLVLLGVGLLTVFYPYASRVTASFPESVSAGEMQQDTIARNCRTHAALETLSALPEGSVLSPLNLGPSILLASGLPVLAAPYHRSAAALSNGLLPFMAKEAAFRRALAGMDADYIVLCRNTPHAGFASELAKGDQVDGLQLVPGMHPALVVYEVIK